MNLQYTSWYSTYIICYYCTPVLYSVNVMYSSITLGGFKSLFIISLSIVTIKYYKITSIVLNLATTCFIISSYYSLWVAVRRSSYRKCVENWWASYYTVVTLVPIYLQFSLDILAVEAV
jgi:hypothetical protein